MSPSALNRLPRHRLLQSTLIHYPDEFLFMYGPCLANVNKDKKQNKNRLDSKQNKLCGVVIAAHCHLGAAKHQLAHELQQKLLWPGP